LLGLFEAAHWRAPIKTTQHLLAPPDRPMGNGVLQSGASIGAIITPLIMSAMLTAHWEAGECRFQLSGRRASPGLISVRHGAEGRPGADGLSLCPIA